MKKGKKKGLQLSPEQVSALTSITGCLKFLSLINSNRYRIANLGSLPHLKALYLDCDKTLLRRNAQVGGSDMHGGASRPLGTLGTLGTRRCCAAMRRWVRHAWGRP